MTERIPASHLREARPDKATERRVDREGPIHRACYNLARLLLPDALIWHTPNEQNMPGTKKARSISIQHLKGLGMLPGFPDLGIFWRGRLLLVEFKAPPNKMTRKQVAVAQVAQSNGAMFACVSDVNEMRASLSSFKAMPPLMAQVPVVGTIS